MGAELDEALIGPTANVRAPGLWEALTGRRLSAENTAEQVLRHLPPTFAKVRSAFVDAADDVLHGRTQAAEARYAQCAMILDSAPEAEAVKWRASLACRRAQLFDECDRSADAEKALLDEINHVEALSEKHAEALSALYHQLGLTYRRSLHDREAMMSFDTAISLLPKDGGFAQRASMLMGRGLSADALGDHDLAGTCFLLAVSQMDQHCMAPSRQKLEAKVFAGHALLASQRYLEAEEVCRQALEMRSLIFCEAHDEAMLWNMLGLSLSRRGKIEESLQAYRTSLRVLSESQMAKPSDLADAHFNLACLSAVQKDVTRLNMHLRKAAEIVDDELKLMQKREGHFRRVFAEHFQDEVPQVAADQLQHLLMSTRPPASR